MYLDKKIYLIYLFMGLVFVLGFLIPETLVIPVKAARASDWNKNTFWYEPWGKSITHKGIDIFAKQGTPVLAASSGIVIFNGELGIGGKVVAVLGPKWRIHYYAHLKQSDTHWASLLQRGEQLGQVGNSGNASHKPPHLHYSILTPIPYPWRWDGATQGWMKMFFLNPGEKLLAK